MQAYKVAFFNELTNDLGHPFHCCQRVIRIRAAKSKERAIVAAKQLFARAEQVQHWRIRASSIEVQEMEFDENNRLSS
jgi:hypothetical protein